MPDGKPDVVGIALPAKHGALYAEMGRMVGQQLERSGYRPLLLEDGDPEGLRVDVLLMLGEGPFFDKYTDLLRERSEGGPLTVLWHLEALPPFPISGLALQKFSASHRLANKVLERGRLTEWVRYFVPKPHLAGLRYYAHWLLFRRFRREMMADIPAQSVMSDADLSYFLTRRYAWFKQCYSRQIIDLVCTCTASQQRVLQFQGVPARLVPVGYHEELGRLLGWERDIDVLFLGDVRRGGRRDRILKEVGRELLARGVELRIVDSGLYGARRRELLNRTKICLNVAHYPWELPGLRFLMSMACGALVVSEALSDAVPFRVGEHFVQSSPDQLVETIWHYLTQERERNRITEAAHCFVTGELTLQKALLSILEVVQERRVERAAELGAAGSPPSGS